jgi:hypothetical protein
VSTRVEDRLERRAFQFGEVESGGLGGHGISLVARRLSDLQW